MNMKDGKGQNPMGAGERVESVRCLALHLLITDSIPGTLYNPLSPFRSVA